MNMKSFAVLFFLYHKRSTRILHYKMLIATEGEMGATYIRFKNSHIKSYLVLSHIVPLGWKNSMWNETVGAPHERRCRLAKASSPGSVCYL